MTASSSTVVTTLAHALRTDPGRPLVTFYDGATDERIELSVKTFANWVAKIANLFGDELMLDPGDRVRVDLPTHWQSGIVLLGAWTAGLTVTLGAPQDDVAANVVGPAALTHPDAVSGAVIACSLRPLGGPFTAELPTGWLDFAREVPPQPDALLIEPAGDDPDAVALSVAGATTTHADLLSQGRQAAEQVRLDQGGRMITDANPARPSGVAAGLVGPIAVGASVVLVTNCDAVRRATIADQERVTSRLWLTG